MNEAYGLVIEETRGFQSQNKRNYDKRATSTVLTEGDRVLVRNLSEKGGPGKLRSYWEEIYIVLSEKLMTTFLFMKLFQSTIHL